MDTRKFIILWAVVFIATVIFAWAPWLTEQRVTELTSTSFTQNWQGVADGCGFNCEGCGVISSRRVLFGAVVEIEYACGMLPSDLPEYHQKATGFVSCFGTIHNLPKP